MATGVQNAKTAQEKALAVRMAKAGYRRVSVLTFLHGRVARLHRKGRRPKPQGALSPCESAVLKWLRAHVDKDGRWVGCPGEILATARHRYKARTIRAALQKLEKLGFLQRFRGDGGSYGIFVPAEKTISLPYRGKELPPKNQRGKTKENGRESPVSQGAVGAAKKFIDPTVEPQAAVMAYGAVGLIDFFTWLLKPKKPTAQVPALPLQQPLKDENPSPPAPVSNPYSPPDGLVRYGRSNMFLDPRTGIFYIKRADGKLTRVD